MTFGQLLFFIFIITFVDGTALFLLSQEYAQTAWLLAFGAGHLYFRSMKKELG